MTKFYYTQTITYTLAVEANSADEADLLVQGMDVSEADTVEATGWEEDGCELE